MKEKIFDIAYRYLILNFAFVPVIVALRIVEYLFLRHDAILQVNPYVIEATGLLFDFRAFLVFALLLFIPFLLVSLLNRKSGTIFYAALLSLLTLLQYSLIRYFSVNLIPLSDILYAYSLDEIIMIARSSDGFNFMSLLPGILLLALVIFLQYAAVRGRKPGTPWVLFAVVYFAALFLALFKPMGTIDGPPEMASQHKINKSEYFLRKTISYILREKDVKPYEQITAEIKRYQENHPEFNFTSKEYPLTHKNTVPDVLGPCFNLTEEPPNLVFIIVESLSQACIGNGSYFGNFTPYLDSLKNQSLYWDNFLSISERTFHVFASLFASLPYGGGELQKDLSQIPFHYSLIRYLRQNGYFTCFYYGGEASFTNYDQFLKKQGIDLILEDFGPAYEEKKKLYPDFFWGYHDEYTFARSLEVIDSLNKDPRLDIYLTLSTHNPFHPPNEDLYQEKYKEITNRTGFPEEIKLKTDRNQEIFTALLYTDDALRNFLKAYSLRDDYQNTIFFITGDHFFMELGYSNISAIERYHVPMIIYSPLLKKPRHFESVSSHQDITPSVIAMLENKYHFPGVPYVHWIGQGLDTSSSFRNIQTLQFITSEQETVDYLDKDYFLSKNRLYHIVNGLRTEPVSDPQTLQRLQEDLQATTVVAKYVTGYDRIILPQLFMDVSFDTVLIYSKDTTGYAFGITPGKYINLIKPIRFNSSYLRIICDMEFRYFLPEYSDTTRFPRLILAIDDSAQKNYLYHQLPFPANPADSATAGRWIPYHAKKVLDLTSIDELSGEFLKLYFYNSRLSNIRCDSLKIKIYGLN